MSILRNKTFFFQFTTPNSERSALTLMNFQFLLAFIFSIFICVSLDIYEHFSEFNQECGKILWKLPPANQKSEKIQIKTVISTWPTSHLKLWKVGQSIVVWFAGIYTSIQTLIWRRINWNLILRNKINSKECWSLRIPSLLRWPFWIATFNFPQVIQKYSDCAENLEQFTSWAHFCISNTRRVMGVHRIFRHFQPE